MLLGYPASRAGVAGMGSIQPRPNTASKSAIPQAAVRHGRGLTKRVRAKLREFEVEGAPKRRFPPGSRMSPIIRRDASTSLSLRPIHCLGGDYPEPTRQGDDPPQPRSGGPPHGGAAERAGGDAFVRSRRPGQIGQAQGVAAAARLVNQPRRQRGPERSPAVTPRSSRTERSRRGLRALRASGNRKGCESRGCYFHRKLRPAPQCVVQKRRRLLIRLDARERGEQMSRLPAFAGNWPTHI
jgi:hypothetical protein